MKYCVKCGNELTEDVKYCPKCGNSVSEEENVNSSVNMTSNQSVNHQSNKSKVAAGILGIFLGAFGIHNFYLGYTGKAVAQLLLTLVGWILCGMGPIVAGIWGFIEGILILAGSIHQDADGNPLSD